MTRRAGLTLTETLVAMFVAALGLIALMTLFPLGALQMGQALKDGRTGQAAQQADGLMRWYWSKHVLPAGPSHGLVDALEYGNRLPVPQTAPNPPVRIGIGDNAVPSYPVFVDPLGWQSRTGATQTRVAGIDDSGTSNPAPPPGYRYYEIPRRTMTIANGNAFLNGKDLLHFTGMQDDISYDDTKSGAPRVTPAAALADSSTTPNTAPVERGGRYNWLWVVQRPDNRRKSSVNLTELVFDGRAPLFAPNSYEVYYSNVNFVPGTTSVTLPYSGTRPAILKGRWIMDGTPALRHANFYRVVSVNDEVPGTLVIDLEKAITRWDGSTASYSGTLVVFAGLAEVFDRPPLVAPAP